MAAISLDPSLRLQHINGKDPHHHGAVVEEIQGLIKVYRDGQVERPQIVPFVTAAPLSLELGVTSRDIVIDKFTNIWARFYVPSICSHGKLPLLVYFHGGGFCVGSAAWSCYHEFLARLSAKAGCLIMSVNYRLAPENPLPAAYEDGLKALIWLKRQSLCGSSDQYWWSRLCDFSKIFLAGDSAGANIAYNVASRLGSNNSIQAMTLKPLGLKGTILIQPFFGGDARTHSESHMVQPPRSALSLSSSDTYWRLALPAGANRDHPWCNPLSTKLEDVRLMPTMVCVSEMDILKDRNLEFCTALVRAGKRAEYVVFKGVGHAFQVLSRCQLSQTRTHEMLAHIKAFLSR
ncbi:hypothetical protein F2P56_011867 [Juglans regia]|uniref:Alpha/beta hydrolase fold-3 domain-containing protein n=2 Tax=Juglans regia TaxID=51240 RepID=A0A834CQ69_JUGRE|nr:probable carboxylesterase 6 [Juglans regia]KAF5467634.1 hypothetical protein F2P56_011867 [Juglans regia]